MVIGLGEKSPTNFRKELIVKKITQELLARGFINKNTASKESIFEYMFNNAVEYANWKSFINWQRWKETSYVKNADFIIDD